MQSLSLALAQATTATEVTDTIISKGMMAFGANAGAIYRFDEAAQEIYAVRVFGFSEETIHPYARHSITLPTPMTEAIRSRSPLYVETRAERDARFLTTSHISETVSVGAVAVIPLQAEGITLGALGLSFAEDRPFSPEDRAFFETIAHLCALSLARAMQFDHTQQALRALKQVEEERNWHYAILESSQAAIIARDTKGRFTLWNKGAERLYGYTATEALGQELSLIASPEGVREIQEAETQLQQGQAVVVREAQRTTREGRPLTVTILLTPLYDGMGQYCGISSVSYDITEKKRTEAELQETLLRLQSLVANAPLAVIEWDADYCIRSWSPEAERLYGWLAGEAIGKFIYEVGLIYPEDQPKVADMVQEMMEGTRPNIILHNRNRTKDGRVLHCEWHNSSLLDESGRLKAVLSFVVDVTAREEAEAAQARLLQEIAAQRKRMDDILSKVPGVVWEAWGQPDASSQRINFVSDYVEEMLGYTVGEWVSTPNFWLSIVHPEDKERAAATAVMAWKTGRQHPNTFRWLTKDGRALWCESHSVVIKDDTGQPVGMRGVTMDVSVRHATEAALRESEARFRELADTVPQMVFAQTPDGITEYVNHQWREYTGLTIEQANNGEGIVVFHPDEREAFGKAWLECRRNGQPFQREFRCRRASDGVYRWFLCRVVPIRNGEGRITRWLGTSTDIDAIKAASAEIEDLNYRLRQAMTETHHRVKNNLQVIAALLDLQTLNGQAVLPRTEFERLSQHIRALATVHDLLTDAAKRDGEAEALSVNAVLDRLLPVLQELVSGDKFRWFSAEDARLTSRQATSFALVTNELVSNALKHGAGEITVHFTVEGQVAQLIVCDDGPGFPDGFDAATAAHTGLDLVQNLTSWDLRGKVTFGNTATGGGQATITFPVELGAT